MTVATIWTMVRVRVRVRVRESGSGRVTARGGHHLEHEDHRDDGGLRAEALPEDPPRARLAAQREEEPRERTRGRPDSTPPVASIMMGITKKPAPTTETAMMAQASRRPGGTAPAPLLHRWYWLSLSSSSGVPPAQRGAAPRRPSCCRTSVFRCPCWADLVRADGMDAERRTKVRGGATRGHALGKQLSKVPQSGPR